MHPKHPRIGLALGSGSARGWAHLGVIRALERAGIVPDIRVRHVDWRAGWGCLCNQREHERFEQWVRSWQQYQWLVWWGLEKMGGGLMAGGKLAAFFRSRYADPGADICGPLAAWPPTWPVAARSGCARVR